MKTTSERCSDHRSSGAGPARATPPDTADSVTRVGARRRSRRFAGIGPVFQNGVRNGAYRMDLGTVQSVSAITSWSHNWKGFRGAQKLVLYGSNAATDPGWDLKRFTPLGTIDPTGETKAEFTAASLRASAGKSLGEFRWIVWAVSPVTERGNGENTAFQELSVEFVR